MANLLCRNQVSLVIPKFLLFKFKIIGILDKITEYDTIASDISE